LKAAWLILVVAGVIGRHKFIYDLWGDAVNTASRPQNKPGFYRLPALYYAHAPAAGLHHRHQQAYGVFVDVPSTQRQISIASESWVRH
jgi:hypothetical protein